jgi:adenosylcobyric acid synthase
MLGRAVADPDGVEGDPGATVEGLGLLDVTTRFGADKVLRLPTGSALGTSVSGYEIHHGRITQGDDEPFLGGARTTNVFGTMWHGSLESDAFRRVLLATVATLAGRTYEPSAVSFAARREQRLDLLGDLVERHLDVDALLTLATDGPPAGLPLLPPGA